MLITYHKIPNVFKRDGKTKKLISNRFVDKSVEYLKDNLWVFTEKIDGTNVRVYWDGYEFNFYGRKEKSRLPQPLEERLKEIFFPLEDIVEELFGNTEVIFFGEGIGEKIQKGKYGKDYDFILFDIYVGGFYLDKPNVYEIAERMGLKVSPIIFEGNIDQAVNFIRRKPKSKFNPEVTIEGIVGVPKVRLYSHKKERIIVKIKVKDIEEVE